MFCSKCGKEITGGEACPICNLLDKTNSNSTENNCIIDMNQELSSLNNEETVLRQKAKNIVTKKKELEKVLKKSKKKFKQSKSSIAKLNFLTALFIILLIYGSVTIAKEMARCSNENYIMEVNNLNQKVGQVYADYEKQFLSSIQQERTAKVIPMLVSPSNKEELHKYVSSLYRHPTNHIQLFSHEGKEYYQVTDAIKFDKYNLLDSSNNTIFPGAIIRGDSLFTNDYTLISTERTPISIMSNQENGTALQIDNPNYSTITTALNDYARNYSGNLAKEWEYSLQSVSTSHELNATLGIGAKNLAFDLGTGVNESKSTTTIVYSQTYYSVSMEPLQNVSDYFTSGINIQILGENEPAYVSSVSYGRKIILVVSSDMSQKDLSAKLNASINGVNIGVGIENVLKDETLKCQLISYGGKDISSILGTEKRNTGVIDNFKAWIWGSDKNSSGLGERLNNFLSDSETLVNPVAISYNLNYLSDNSVVPAMYINNDFIMLGENTHFVSLSLNNMKNNNFIIDASNLPAILLNKDNITFQNGKVIGSYFEFLWNSAYGIPLILTYEGKLENAIEYKIDFATCELDKKILLPVQEYSQLESLLDFKQKGTIEIYKTNPKMLLNKENF